MSKMAMSTSISTNVRRLWSLPKAFLAILVICGIMVFLNTPFYSSFNLVSNILTSNSIFLILAMGETIVLIAGGVDLSIGGIMTVGGIIAILLIR